MRIAILSNHPKSYSTNRIKDAARARGHSVRILNTSSFALDIQSGNPDLLYKGKPVYRPEAIIPRIAASQSLFGTSVVRQFEHMGVYTLNPSFAVSVAQDKLRTMQILSRHNIGIPHTAFVFQKGDIEPALEKLGGAPVIIKLLHGTQGAGVMLVDKTAIAKAIVEALQVANHQVLLQRFVSESEGRDIRAFVIGDRVVASMRRTAQEGEFRSNVHLGAHTEVVELPEAYQRAAVQAAQILGLRIAGVDILESSSGPQILEINSSPGLEGIEGATKLDIASMMIEYAEEQVQFPDLDLRQRLSLSKGYSVAEIPVLQKSSIAGKSIEDAGLLEQEIQVLSIVRESITIPMPRSSEVLYPGDSLLCFGKQLSLSSLVPPKRKRRKPQKLPENLPPIEDSAEGDAAFDATPPSK